MCHLKYVSYAKYLLIVKKQKRLKNRSCFTVCYYNCHVPKYINSDTSSFNFKPRLEIEGFSPLPPQVETSFRGLHSSIFLSRSPKTTETTILTGRGSSEKNNYGVFSAGSFSGENLKYWKETRKTGQNASSIKWNGSTTVSRQGSHIYKHERWYTAQFKKYHRSLVLDKRCFDRGSYLVSERSSCSDHHKVLKTSSFGQLVHSFAGSVRFVLRSSGDTIYYDVQSLAVLQQWRAMGTLWSCHLCIDCQCLCDEPWSFGRSRISHEVPGHGGAPC